MSSTSLANYRPMVERFEQYCLELGRDPSTIRKTWAGGCACAPTQEEAVALVADQWNGDDDEDFDFIGTPKQLIDQMRPFIALGVYYFMFDCGGFPKLTTLEMLINEVLPAFAEHKVKVQVLVNLALYLMRKWNTYLFLNHIKEWDSVNDCRI